MNIKIKHFFFANWSIFVLVLLVLVIFKQNYIPNTQLIGWDNLLPELNFNANIQRSIFAVWQEYQGLGLLGGMAHASDILHQLFLLLISYVIPAQILRYFWTFLMLFLGGLGTYYFIKDLILKESVFTENKKKSLSLIGGFFYILNLSTIQTFYAPFEAFIAHFAALPWLLLASLVFLFKPNLKNGTFFAIVLTLATPQAYLPTLFVVYILSLLIISFILKIVEKSSFSLFSFIKMFLMIFIINAFWLLPFVYFTFTNSQVTLDAKINQMSTQTVFLQNKAYGNIFDVILLKGFWFSNVDPNLKGVFTYMLSPWRDYLSNPSIQILGYLFFIVILIGIIAVVKTKKSLSLALFILFLFSITMLLTNTIPFSWIDILFRKIPLFEEAFRFPFTKFSVLTSFTYSVFFVLGIAKLSLMRFTKKINFYLFCLIPTILLVIFTFPVFKGYLFYEKERLNLPGEYFRLFKYFGSQNPNTRIANLPQPTFWGWEFYRWGYGGSGFLWYGVKQPILDRAFDVWSSQDENYYWEISQALYSRNPLLFENVLNKYQINWLVVDKNLIYPASPLSLFFRETADLIKQIPSIQKTAAFGNIDIYKVSLRDKVNNFVFSTGNLTVANPYAWGNLDKVYVDFGNYTSLSDNQGYFYPFRSLFSNKNQKNKSFKMELKDDSIILQAPLPKYNSGFDFDLPSFPNTEKIIASTLTSRKDTQGLVSLYINLQTPEISVLNKNSSQRTVIYSRKFEIPLVTLPQGYDSTLNININGVKSYKFNPSSSNIKIGTTFFVLNQDNIIVISGVNFATKTVTVKTSEIQSLLNDWLQKAAIPNPKNAYYMQVSIPKIDDNYEGFRQDIGNDTAKRVSNCDNFNSYRLSSRVININDKKLLELYSEKSTACLFYYASNLVHNQGYAVFLENSNQTGRALHFWVLDEDEKYSPIDTFLSGGKDLKQASFILPPGEDFGRAYSFHFENISILNEPTVNRLGDFYVFPVPYNFISSIKLSSGEKNQTFNRLDTNAVSRPNLYEYVIENSTIKGKSLVILSQAFDKGWNAYQIAPPSSTPINFLQRTLPSLFGRKINKHILVNNWENGWIIDNPQPSTLNSQLVIVYLPQYLEYLGFLLLIISFIYLTASLIFGKIKNK